MPTPLTSVLAFAALPVATAVAGAAVAAVRPPPPHVQSLIQHFAAGVVFAVVAVELLPDITRLHTLPATIVGFAAGVACMLGVRALTRRLAPEGEPLEAEAGGTAPGAGGAPAPNGTRSARPVALPAALLAGVGIDVLIDGLLLGIGFAAGAREGALLAVALGAELLSLGLATSAELREAGVSAGRAVAVSGGGALLLVAGALGGATALRGLGPHAMAGVLSFGSAALLYLVTEELLVEAHEVPETALSTATFFAGFLLLFVLQLAAA